MFDIVFSFFRILIKIQLQTIIDEVNVVFHVPNIQFIRNRVKVFYRTISYRLLDQTLHCKLESQWIQLIPLLNQIHWIIVEMKSILLIKRLTIIWCQMNCLIGIQRTTTIPIFDTRLGQSFHIDTTWAFLRMSFQVQHWTIHLHIM